MAGCASPGSPLPPTLNLPAIIENGQLSASRVGDTVELHWTTPTRNTDKLLIKGPVTAVICRDPQVTSTVGRTGQRTAAPPCSPVQRQEVAPGASHAVDPLPNALATGPARLVAYRVELLNSAGRTAGPSAPVLVPGGAAPAAIADLHADGTKDGVLLRWNSALPSEKLSDDPQLLAAELGTTVELTRVKQSPPATPAKTPAAATPSGPSPAKNLLGESKEPTEERFQAGNVDAGGTLDRTARIGSTYSYIAQRVHTVSIGGESYELRSTPSAAVTVAVRDVFPPAVPGGLVAIGALQIIGAVPPLPSIDLSWEPDVEPRVAGYRVYRRESTSPWQRLTADPVPAAAYHDAAVVAGHIYTYRVTAVSSAGNESAPGNEATETAPTP